MISKLEAIVGAVLATDEKLPPMRNWYEYVLARNGLFVRSEDDLMEAMIPAARLAALGTSRKVEPAGLIDVRPYARLKVARVDGQALTMVWADAVKAMPNEAMYQIVRADGGWRVWRPAQQATPGGLQFADCGAATIDLHSHGRLPAFFSETDNADEKGLRFYVVIGQVNSKQPEVLARVGVYGHHWCVPAGVVFEQVAEPFVDRNSRLRPEMGVEVEYAK